MQRLRLELNRIAQERDNYKQKWEAMGRSCQQHSQLQQQQQQHQKVINNNNSRTATGAPLTDGSPAYYLQ